MKRISYIFLALLAVACGGANKQTSDSPATNEAATNVDDDSDESLPF